jgi:hypothetical protein
MTAEKWTHPLYSEQNSPSQAHDKSASHLSEYFYTGSIDVGAPRLEGKTLDMECLQIVKIRYLKICNG